MHRLIEFYARLPRGPRVAESPSHWLLRYKAKYFDGRGSGKPLLHYAGIMLLFGYLMSYYFHLLYMHSIYNIRMAYAVYTYSASYMYTHDIYGLYA
ncbi:F1F0 ATP synthase subunit f [Pneumocystis jirovecii RU7]|uniref:ATP synthase subunit f, mitochondrial n=1 Tax=Pneumocystis jirovecii (strain RU7) TaxID=1408657 RepID=A0A0W4ZVD0_PNEJ7|nr:F1F0 ATP synthase subunit f [Pneumocystis jirovecii RU7]KTW32329.1 hypothetical protein T551_00419 [Pneumocystis jirovecii RU7]